MYSDADAAALYDQLNPWGPSDDFYLSNVMAAPSVLDVGCGTGMLLHRAREASHTGMLCGVDPDLRGSLAATRAALVDGGRLVFGTRNPRVRAWEGWNPSNPIDVVDPAGRELRIRYQVESVTGDMVTFTETTATRAGEPLRVDRASLRFLDAEGVDRALGAAGFEVEARYGDWSRGPFTGASDNIVTVARASSPASARRSSSSPPR